MSAASIETQMMLEDAHDVVRIVYSSRKIDGGAILSLGFAPLACFFVVGAYDCLQKRHAQGAHRFLEKNAPRIRAIRSRLKLVDADGFDEARRRFDAIERANFQIFYGGHRGLLAWLKRRIQDDLGFFFVGPDLVCTTQMAFANMGHDDQNLDQMDHRSRTSLGPELGAFSQNLGEYIHEVITLFGERSKSSDITYSTITIEAEDHKARVAYRLIGERLESRALTLAAVFTWLTSQVNYVHRCLRKILDPDSSFFFRIRFLTAYHLGRALSSIGSILKGDRRCMLGKIVAELRARDGDRKLRKLSVLRNAIAHYDASMINNEKGRPLDLLVRRLAGIERQVLSDVLDGELEAASVQFRQIVAKGALGRSTVPLRN
jgi:hypothetical protein